MKINSQLFYRLKLILYFSKMGCLLSYLKSYNIFAAAAAAESIPETPKVYSWCLEKNKFTRLLVILH